VIGLFGRFSLAKAMLQNAMATLTHLLDETLHPHLTATAAKTHLWSLILAYGFWSSSSS